MKEINYISILSKVTGISEQDIEFRNEVQCIRPSEVLEAIKLALNMANAAFSVLETSIELNQFLKKEGELD